MRSLEGCQVPDCQAALFCTQLDLDKSLLARVSLPHHYLPTVAAVVYYIALWSLLVPNCAVYCSYSILLLTQPLIVIGLDESQYVIQRYISKYYSENKLCQTLN